MNGDYRIKTQKWRSELERHLLREEIKWVATHGGAIVDYFKPYVGNEAAIIGALHDIGFKIKRIFTVEHIFVETSGGIAVCVEDGFCHK